MEDKEKFARFWKEYIKLIAPKYRELENERLQNQRKLVKEFFRWFLLWGSLALCAASVLAGGTDDDTLFIIVFVIAFFTAAFFAVRDAISLCEIETKSGLKCIAVDELLKIFSDEIYHRSHLLKDKEKSMLSNLSLKKSELFFNFNEVRFGDIIYGTYKGVNFEIAETKMKTCMPNGAKSSYNEPFEGVILAYRNNKKTKCNTLVSTKNILMKNNVLMKSFLIICEFLGFCFIKGIIDIIYQNSYFLIIISAFLFIVMMLFALCGLVYANRNNYFKTFNKITLENDKFNKKFNTYSSDEVEARYLLTPAFMERFYNLKTAFAAKNIRCSFYEDILMIAVETKKDLFEFGSLFNPVNDKNSVYEFYKESTSIFDIIDALNLQKS